MSAVHLVKDNKDDHDPVNGTAQLNDRCALYAVVDVLIQNGILDLQDYRKAFFRLLAELDQLNAYGDTLNEDDFKNSTSLVSKEKGLDGHETTKE